MVNYDGLFEVEARYTVTISGRAIEHRHTFDVEPEDALSPGADPETINVLLKNGFALNLIEAVDDVMVLAWKLMGTGTSDPVFTLWKYDPEPSLAKTFICTWVPVDVYTLAASAAAAAQQGTFTFRSSNGGICRMQLMEMAGSRTDSVMASTLIGDAAAYADFLVSGFSPVRARDEGLLVAAYKASFGQNEKVARLRFRTA